MISDIVQYCSNLIGSIFTWSKTKALCGGVFATAIFLLGDSVNAFFLLVVLIVIDLLMALIVIAKTDLHFQSAKLRHSAIKLMVYFLIVVGGIQMDKIMHFPHSGFLPDEPIAKIALVVLAATEMLSVLEHASQLGFVIPIRLFRNIKKIRDGK